MCFKCIIRNAELICELLRLASHNHESKVTEERQYALNLMMYRGSEYACAAAVMLYVPVSTKTKLSLTSLCLFFDVNGCPGLIAKLLLQGVLQRRRK